MANRTVRAIFQANVTSAIRSMTGLSQNAAQAGQQVETLQDQLKRLGAQQVKADIQVKTDDAKERLSDLTIELGRLRSLPASAEVDVQIEQAKANIAAVRDEIRGLESQKTQVEIQASIDQAQQTIATVTAELGQLRTLEVTPQVTADIQDAQKRLREAQAALRELDAAQAQLTVTADTSQADNALNNLSDSAGQAGQAGGALAGYEMVKGIVTALAAIPVVGAVVGIGKSIVEGIFQGIQEGLQVEASRDLFSARTGLDEATSARFGRAAGEAYSNAYGESIESNLDAARMALAGGLIDSKATDAEIENVIAKLTGLQDLFEYDIPSSVRAVGNALKTGLVKDADQAFDLITAASQKLPSDDLLDTLNEYSNQWVLTGLSGEQAMGLIIQGAKAGARDTDIVADALKELGLRAREGTDPAIQALKDLGLNAQDTVKAFQEGGPKATSALGDVFDALRTAKDEGKNTQSIITNLFGGPGEDLGAALFALDLDTVSAALGGVNGSAGAADRALATMADNSASKIEAAKRNIEVAMDGIKGALAEAFSEEIDGAAQWVSRNREPIIQFFLDVINGAIDAGISLAEFTASGIEGIGRLAGGFAALLESIDGFFGLDTTEASASLRDLANAANEGAESIRTEVPDALEDVRDKVNTWAAPELLKARVHDATVAMAEDMDKFSAKVDESGGTVTINGEKKNAEEVLKILTENIDASDGTVTINGDKVPAADALDRIINLINRGEGTVDIGGNTRPGEGKLNTLKGKISAAEASMSISADTSSAEYSLAALKAKYRTLNIRVSGVSSVGGVHEGGWTGRPLPGLNAGGWVPGHDPGYDNVLWPLNRGGRTLWQPLAGDEFVVNSQASGVWAPLLEAINGGMKPPQVSSSGSGRSVVYSITAPSTDARDIVRAAESAERRKAALYPNWGP